MGSRAVLEAFHGLLEIKDTHRPSMLRQVYAQEHTCSTFLRAVRVLDLPVRAEDVVAPVCKVCVVERAEDSSLRPETHVPYAVVLRNSLPPAVIGQVFPHHLVSCSCPIQGHFAHTKRKI